MKDNQVALEVQLSQFFDVHLSRLKCLSALVLGLIHLRTVNLAELALCIHSAASVASRYKRIQRFLRLFDFPLDALCLMIWRMFDDGTPVVLSLDRTNWKLGKKNINILMLSLCHESMAIPLLWTVLEDKRGNSSEKERIDLMERFLKIIQPDFVVKLVADREFIGQNWLTWLDKHHIHYVIRIRKNQLVAKTARKEVYAWQVFPSTRFHTLRKAREVSGVPVFLGGKALEKGDYLILISNLPLQKGIHLYRMRWQIELLFGALKSKGFNFEQTHLTQPNRIAKLIALLAIAVAWAVKVGSFKTQKGKSIPIKKHKRRAISLFRIGLDYLRASILTFKPLNDLVHFLSCT